MKIGRDIVVEVAPNQTTCQMTGIGRKNVENVDCGCHTMLSMHHFTVENIHFSYHPLP